MRHSDVSRLCQPKDRKSNGRSLPKDLLLLADTFVFSATRRPAHPVNSRTSTCLGRTPIADIKADIALQSGSGRCLDRAAKAVSEQRGDACGV